MITNFRLTESYEPNDLLKLNNDAFFKIIEQDMALMNNGVNIEVLDADIEFETETVNYADYVYIRVNVTKYEVTDKAA